MPSHNLWLHSTVGELIAAPVAVFGKVYRLASFRASIAVWHKNSHRTEIRQKPGSARSQNSKCQEDRNEPQQRHSVHRPQTERGKRNSSINAVTIELFAEHVAIPVCDGEEAEKDFLSLPNEAHEEFRPVGFYEEWLVVKIAESS